MEWFVPCNINHYDVFSAFSELRRVNWGQTVRQIKPGDTAYIYVTAPYSAISLKCRVNKAGLKPEEAMIDDSKFDLTHTENEPYAQYMELEIVAEYASPLFALAELKRNGLTQTFSTHEISPQLSAYLARVAGRLSEEAEDNSLIQAVNEAGIGSASGFAYQGKRKEKRPPKKANGQMVYVRDRQISLNALELAGYRCEIDRSHATFIRKNWNKPYTEPHHLVPLSYSDDFDVSLDVEENIVSLCSNCHNRIHYGKDADVLLKQLYSDRKDLLEQAGIIISLDELLGMYQ